MTIIYKVVFLPRAKRRFDKLDAVLRRQIAKKLEERTRNPRVPKDALSKMPNCYKIKLRSSGIRVIYQVQEERLVLLVLAAGSREGEEAYEDAATALLTLDD